VASEGFPTGRGLIEVDNSPDRAENVCFKNLNIIGNGVADYGILLRSSRGTTIEQVAIYNCVQNAIRMYPGDYDVNVVKIDNCFFYSSGSSHIEMVPNETTDAHVTDVRIYNTFMWGSGTYSVRGVNTSMVLISGCFISPFDEDNKSCISIESTTDSSKRSALWTIADVCSESALHLLRIYTANGASRCHTIRLLNCRKYPKDTGPHVLIEGEGVETLLIDGCDFWVSSVPSFEIIDDQSSNSDNIFVARSNYWNRDIGIYNFINDPNGVITIEDFVSDIAIPSSVSQVTVTSDTLTEIGWIAFDGSGIYHNVALRAIMWTDNSEHIVTLKLDWVNDDGSYNYAVPTHTIETNSTIPAMLESSPANRNRFVKMAKLRAKVTAGGTGYIHCPQLIVKKTGVSTK